MNCPTCGGLGKVRESPAGDDFSDCDACGGDGRATAMARANALLEAFKLRMERGDLDDVIDKLDELAASFATAGAEAYLASMVSSGIEQLEKLKDDQ